MHRRSLPYLVLLLILAPAPSLAADYWPQDGPRTYVFGDGASEARLVIAPQAGAPTQFRVFSDGCEISWLADVEPNGRLTATTGEIDCAEVSPVPVPLEFENGAEVLLDRAWIGGNVQTIQASTNGDEQVLYVRVGEARPVTIPEGTFDAVAFEVSILPPPFFLPIVSIDLSRDSGPVRVAGEDRTAVLDGIVRNDVRSWSAVKARFGQ